MDEIKELHIRQFPSGAISVSRTPAYVDSDTVNAICLELVQGRDIDDGLAPLYVIAAILERKLKDRLPQSDREYVAGVALSGFRPDWSLWEWPEPPGWLGGDWQPEWELAGRDASKELEAFRRNHQLTPLIVALASLPGLGGDGDVDAITLRRKEQS